MASKFSMSQSYFSVKDSSKYRVKADMSDPVDLVVRSMMIIKRIENRFSSSHVIAKCLIPRMAGCNERRWQLLALRFQFSAKNKGMA